MKKVYIQLKGRNRKKGRMVIITSFPIEFEDIEGIRGLYEKGLKESLTEVVKKYKAKEFSSKYGLPVSTVKRLRKTLGISRSNTRKKLSEELEFIKITNSP